MKKEKIFRTALLLSLAMNMLFFTCLWILEARVSKLESKHTNNSTLKMSIP